MAAGGAQEWGNGEMGGKLSWWRDLLCSKLSVFGPDERRVDDGDGDHVCMYYCSVCLVVLEVVREKA